MGNAPFSRSDYHSAMADSSEASSLFPPQKLLSRDDFVYDEHSDDDYLGYGSFSEVYKAKIKSTGQIVAAKVLFRQNGLRGRLQKEYVSLVKLKPKQYLYSKSEVTYGAVPGHQTVFAYGAVPGHQTVFAYGPMCTVSRRRVRAYVYSKS